MGIGESGTVVVSPNLGYGDYDPNGLRVVSRGEVPDDYLLGSRPKQRRLAPHSRVLRDGFTDERFRQ